jgi:hypothetical protein
MLYLRPIACKQPLSIGKTESKYQLEVLDESFKVTHVMMGLGSIMGCKRW